MRTARGRSVSVLSQRLPLRRLGNGLLTARLKAFRLRTEMPGVFLCVPVPLWWIYFGEPEKLELKRFLRVRLRNDKIERASRTHRGMPGVFLCVPVSLWWIYFGEPDKLGLERFLRRARLRNDKVERASRTHRGMPSDFLCVPVPLWWIYLASLTSSDWRGFLRPVRLRNDKIDGGGVNAGRLTTLRRGRR